MRGAFIVRLDLSTNASSGVFEGWVEEVDSGREIRFHSSQELLSFLTISLQGSHSSSQQVEECEGVRGDKEG
jgi:hypothetical protein